MSGPNVKGINGAAGTVIKTPEGEVADPASKRVGAKTTEKKPVAAKDVVDKAAPKTVTTTPPDWQTRVADLERQLQTERTARVALETRVQDSEKAERQGDLDQAKADREKGWLKKGLMDILMLFLRMFFPIINLISLIVRVVRLGYKKFVKGETIDWKREGMLLLADLAGAAPMLGMLGGPIGFLGGAAIGGVISAGIHGAVKVTSEDKDDMLGMEKKEASGLRIGWEKAKGLGTETYAAITGKEKPSETKEIEESGIDTRPVKAGDIPVN
jgi:hypothetical protein